MINTKNQIDKELESNGVLLHYIQPCMIVNTIVGDLYMIHGGSLSCNSTLKNVFISPPSNLINYVYFSYYFLLWPLGHFTPNLDRQHNGMFVGL